MLENGDAENNEGSKESMCELLSRSPNQFVKSEIFQKAFKKKYFHTNNNNRILIHCSLGVSRSSTIAIMYIMKKFSVCFEEVLYHLFRLVTLCGFKKKLLVQSIHFFMNWKH